MVQRDLFGGIAECGKCGLYLKCNSPRMKAHGNGKYKMLIVGEAPGATEDSLGKQFVGESGNLLRYLFEEHGHDFEDFRVINAVNCRPPGNRKPKDSEIKACFPMVYDEIKRFKPNVILLIGEIAVKSVIGRVFKEAVKGIGRWRGLVIPDQFYKAWVVSTYHPSYLLRNSYDESLERIVSDDIRKALDKLDVSVPDNKDLFNRFEILTDRMDIYLLLEEVVDRKPEFLAFDYETNSLKPFNKATKIKTISVCFDGKVGYSFPLYNDNRIFELWKAIMTDDKIKKIAHNLKFENLWTNVKFSVRVKNFFWDTMVMAHVLDNRRYITSLDFQVYQWFGLYGYSKSVSNYLKAGSGNELNKIDDLDIRELLKYNALDSFFTYKIFEKQVEHLGGRSENGRMVLAPDYPAFIPEM